MLNKNNYAVIMAGGIGSRFWPMSKSSFPKQFLDILGTGETLIQQTFSRLERICPTENILIVTNKNYKNLCLEQLSNVVENNILCEPVMRNTAPCVAYAAFKIQSMNVDANMIIAAAIATSGDGIFPLLAENRKDGLIVSGLGLVTALVVGYISLALGL